MFAIAIHGATLAIAVSTLTATQRRTDDIGLGRRISTVRLTTVDAARRMIMDIEFLDSTLFRLGFFRVYSCRTAKTSLFHLKN